MVSEKIHPYIAIVFLCYQKLSKKIKKFIWPEKYPQSTRNFKIQN
jgi:hypothetical protein